MIALIRGRKNTANGTLLASEGKNDFDKFKKTVLKRQMLSS